MRLSEVLGSDVRTEAGDRLGTVHEVRAELSEGRALVVALVLGRRGLRARLGIRRGAGARDEDGANVVSWDDVVAVGRGTIVVRAR